jgi:hypothetical protein
MPLGAARSAASARPHDRPPRAGPGRLISVELMGISGDNGRTTGAPEQHSVHASALRCRCAGRELRSVARASALYRFQPLSGHRARNKPIPGPGVVSSRTARPWDFSEPDSPLVWTGVCPWNQRHSQMRNNYCVRVKLGVNFISEAPPPRSGPCQLSLSLCCGPGPRIGGGLNIEGHTRNTRSAETQVIPSLYRRRIPEHSDNANRPTASHGDSEV